MIQSRSYGKMSLFDSYTLAMKNLGILLLLTFILSACQTNKPKIDDQIRSPSEENGSVIDVTPMLPDAVLKLIEQAEDYKQQAAFTQAITTLQRALRISPDSPLVQQHLAEMFLADGDYKQALMWSEKVVNNGPSHGQLCQRARRVVSLAAEMLGDTVKQGHALESIAHCIQKSTPRF